MTATLSIRVGLTPAGIARLQRPVNGEGGFQSLLRELQRRVQNDSELVLTPALAARIARYVKRYGNGGFQGRLDAVLAVLTELAEALRPMAA
jgi:hypothetical protein